MLPVPSPEAHLLQALTPGARHRSQRHAGMWCASSPAGAALSASGQAQCLTHLTCERLTSLRRHQHASFWHRSGSHRDLARAARQPAAAGSRCSPGYGLPGSLRAPDPSQTLCSMSRHTLSFVGATHLKIRDTDHHQLASLAQMCPGTTDKQRPPKDPAANSWAAKQPQAQISLSCT